jgi:hypothetical protein
MGKPKTRVVFGGVANMKHIDPHFSWPAVVWNLSRIAEDEPVGSINGPFDQEDFGNAFILPLISSDGTRYSIPGLQHGEAIVLRDPDNGAVLINEITMEGRKRTSAKALLKWVNDGMIEPSIESIEGM